MSGERVVRRFNVTVDHYSPVISPEPSSGSYILSGSRVTVSARDRNEIVWMRVQVLNRSVYASGNSTSFTVPTVAGTLHVNVTAMDALGVEFNSSILYHVLVRGGGAGTMEPINGSVLNTSAVELWWPAVTGVSMYMLALSSGNVSIRESLTFNRTVEHLGNGEWNATVYGMINGTAVALWHTSFTVITYAPSIRLVVERHAVSFSGNGSVKDVEVFVATNTTSVISLYINGELVASGQGEGLTFNVTPEFAPGEEGNISVMATATGPSGVVAVAHSYIYYNNSGPPAIVSGTVYTSSHTIRIGTDGLEVTVLPEAGLSAALNGSTMDIYLETVGTYNITLNVTTRCGVWSLEGGFTAVYSDRAPAISASVTVHGNSINVNYTVTSQVPLRYVNITVGNRILRARAPSGNLEFEAPSNGGVYRVRIVAFADNGLNSSYNSSVTVLFYPPELAPFPCPPQTPGSAYGCTLWAGGTCPS